MLIIFVFINCVWQIIIFVRFLNQNSRKNAKEFVFPEKYEILKLAPL